MFCPRTLSPTVYKIPTHAADEGLRGQSILQSTFDWFCYRIAQFEFTYIEQCSNEPLQHCTLQTWSWEKSVVFRALNCVRHSRVTLLRITNSKSTQNQSKIDCRTFWHADMLLKCKRRQNLPAQQAWEAIPSTLIVTAELLLDCMEFSGSYST